MKIKKISIHGFKSFVDKVTLTFPAGTSGIIGPNGCGKSNIVDAIRWVLGEQNARHLRGKHMEDIIFNGSESRKPVGMAEVVLTFSNEDRELDLDLAEVSVTRKLHRDGESEYYLNGEAAARGRRRGLPPSPLRRPVSGPHGYPAPGTKAPRPASPRDGAIPSGRPDGHSAGM